MPSLMSDDASQLSWVEAPPNFLKKKWDSTLIYKITNI